MKEHGPWKIVQSNQVYQDPWVTLRQDDVIRPDGDPGSYVVVNLKPGVCVLAMDEHGNVFLTKEFHYGVGCVTVECVSGGIESGEDPQLCAKRELEEELGIVATEWTDLGSTDPFTANVVSPTRMYLARTSRSNADRPGSFAASCGRGISEPPSVRLLLPASALHKNASACESTLAW